MSRRARSSGEGSGAEATRWTRHAVGASDQGLTVQEILSLRLGVSRRLMQKLTRADGVLLNGRRAYLKRKVREGDVVAARLAFPEDPGVEAIEMPLVIVHEDAHLLVIDKPAGLLVHPVGRSAHATLAHGVTHHLLSTGIRTRVRPVHRLDRDTSGLIVFAKSAAVHHALDRQLRAGELRRSYLAFVRGWLDPPGRTIEAAIGRHPIHPHLRRVVVEGGDRALTHVVTVERFPGVSLVEARLETGRTHQIRVHLAHIGHPLLGDAQYGGRGVGGPERQALHAAELSFRHPDTGRTVELRSQLPVDLDRLRAELRTEGQRVDAQG